MLTLIFSDLLQGHEVDALLLLLGLLSGFPETGSGALGGTGRGPGSALGGGWHCSNTFSQQQRHPWGFQLLSL